MEASAQLHVLADLLSGKETQVHMGMENINVSLNQLYLKIINYLQIRNMNS
jgi:hypothetical protein